MKIKVSGVSRAGSVLLALITAFAAALSCLSVNAMAFDSASARHGVVAVVFYLKDAYLQFVDPNTEKIVETRSLGAECSFSRGSGFFVGESGEDPQYIVTNHHVVSDYIAANEGEEYVYNAGKNSQGYYIFYTASACEMRIYYDENNYDVAYIDCYGDQGKVDLAVLKLRNGTNKRSSLKIDDVSNDNTTDNVYAVGYPGNADNDLTSASKYGEQDSSVYTGTISKIVMDSKGVERIDMTAAIQHGNSGGPLLNESGYVIGVNTNGWIDDDEKNYYALSSNTLMNFLDKNNIPYEKASGASDTDDSDEDSVAADISTASTSSSGNIAVIIGVAAVVIVVVAVVVVKKKKSAPSAAAKAVPVTQAAQQSAPVQHTGEKKAMIRSMAAQHNGKTFPVGKAPVVIGRNPGGCVIVFKDGTQGVSGTHCSVSYDAARNIFTLTDLGSTYGTFLISGQKLTANNPVVLKPGDNFYVGDKANVMRVEVGQ